MIPVVNNKYRYIFFYNPKSACSVARKLFLDLHRNELSQEQLRDNAETQAKHGEDEWYNVHRLFPVDLSKDYSSYYKFTLVRHPFTRFVSAYLNRVVMFESDRELIKEFLEKKYGPSYNVNFSFNQFLDFFSNTPLDQLENEHYLPQCYFKNSFHSDYITTEHSKISVSSLLKKAISRAREIQAIHIDSICKMETLESDLRKTYQIIFSGDTEKLNMLDNLLTNLPMHNVTPSELDVSDNAGGLSVEELMAMEKMPSYSSFLTDDVTETLYKKYTKDFQLLGYAPSLSETLLKFESNKNTEINKTIPSDFDWQTYLSNNPDLNSKGMNTQAEAVSHWIHHGRHENRTYKN